MYKLSKADREFIETHRGQYDSAVRWYAVMTHWGRERKIRDQVQRDFGAAGVQELLLPELTGEDSDAGGKRGELLFGGHLFLRCQMSDDIYMGLANHPWVFKVFGRAFRIPDVIGDHEMDIFKRVLVSVPRPCLVTRSLIGTTATVSEGLMAGLQGRVVGVSSKFVKLETRFSFQDHTSSVVVSVPQEHVILDSSNMSDAAGVSGN
jgi:transcription antitermination factor NusG